MVGWDNEPWRPLGAGVMEHVFVCRHVLVPDLGVSRMSAAEKLPVFSLFARSVLRKAHPLLLLRNVQEELQDYDAVVK